MTEKKDNVVAFEPKQEVKEEATDTLSQENPHAMPISPLSILKDRLGISPETVAKLERADEVITEIETLLQTTVTDHVTQNLTEKHERDISIPLEALTRMIGALAKEMDTLVPQEEYKATFTHHQNVRVKMSEAINNAMADVAEEIDGPLYAQDLYLSLIIVLASHMSQHRIHSFFKMFDQQAPAKTDEQTDNI